MSSYQHIQGDNVWSFGCRTPKCQFLFCITVCSVNFITQKHQGKQRANVMSVVRVVGNGGGWSGKDITAAANVWCQIKTVVYAVRGRTGRALAPHNDVKLNVLSF